MHNDKNNNNNNEMYLIKSLLIYFDITYMYVLLQLINQILIILCIKMHQE